MEKKLKDACKNLTDKQKEQVKKIVKAKKTKDARRNNNERAMGY